MERGKEGEIGIRSGESMARKIYIKRLSKYEFFVIIDPIEIKVGNGIYRITKKKKMDIAELYDILKKYGIKEMKQISENEFEIETLR